MANRPIINFLFIIKTSSNRRSDFANNIRIVYWLYPYEKLINTSEREEYLECDNMSQSPFSNELEAESLRFRWVISDEWTVSEKWIGIRRN